MMATGDAKTWPLFGVVHDAVMEQAALEVMRSGRIASGEHVVRFEQALAAQLSAPRVVSTIDMTSALRLALHLAGVEPGDEVLASPFACMSTNAAIAQCGAIPVWVDMAPGTVELDMGDLVAKRTARTKAVLLYHVAGYPADAAAIAAFCRATGIALIEDCNNALSARRDGIPVGTAGDFAVFSFYPNRQINTCEGGALVCRDASMDQRARRLRRFGIDGNTFRSPVGEINPDSDIPEIGWGMTLNNLSAALGCAQLPTLAGRMARTRDNAERLTRLLADTKGLRCVPAGPASEPAYWGLLTFVRQRDTVLEMLKRAGVHTSALHMRNDGYSGFGAAACALPHLDYLQAHLLALPCGWWLDAADMDAIAGIVDATMAGLPAQ